MSRHQEKARLAAQTALGAGYFEAVLEAPAIARDARTGQFALVGCRPADEPLVDPILLRPFSFLARDPAAGTVSIFYRVVGRGTDLLSRAHEGDRFELVGPLGRAWPEPEAREVLLVAGGVGMPPLLDLAIELGADHEVTVFYGGRSKDHIHLVDRFEAAGARLVVTTDDGSLGARGTNVEALRAHLEHGDHAPTVYACGPEGMLAATAALTREKDVRAFVSVEAPMACGIGVCRGCAVRTKDGYRMACVDGPVFDAREVYP